MEQNADNDGTSYTDQFQLTVVYTDATGYFQDASGNEPTSLSAFVGVNVITSTSGGGSSSSGQNQTIVLAQQPDGTYQGTVSVTVGGYDDGMSKEVIDSAAFGFSNAAGVWDSNDGANYTVSLGDIS
jgi:hypothetical protein